VCLTECVYDRTSEDGICETLVIFATFELKPGQDRDYLALLFFPDEFTLDLAGVWEGLANANHGFQQAPS
jgi:hypothetical protein